jgi:hypothetical protein
MISLLFSLRKYIPGLWLIILPVGFVVAQPAIQGDWSGNLNHLSCMGTRSILRAELSFTLTDNKATGTIAYYTGYHSTFDLSEPIFSFPVSGQLKDDLLVLRYNAMDEIRSVRNAIGFYVMGSYSLFLRYSTVNERENLRGPYAGSNGGRGELVLMRKKEEDVKENHSTVLASLRQKQQQRKLSAELFADNLLKNDSTLTSAIPSWIAANDSLKQLYESEKNTGLAKKSRTDSLFAIWNIPDSIPYIDLSFYDNATIDNDSISLFVDDVLVLHRQPLRAEPLQFRVYKPEDKPGASVILTVVAENLGAIPPNTALLQTTINGKLVRLSISSSFFSNGKIECIWRP